MNQPKQKRPRIKTVLVTYTSGIATRVLNLRDKLQPKSIASYHGWLVHSDSINLENKLLNHYKPTK